MRRRLAWLLGAIGVAGLVAWFRRRREPEPAPVPDAHAEELRRTLEETRVAAEEAQHGSPAPPQEGDVDARRQDVHERARSALEEMGPSP